MSTDLNYPMRADLSHTPAGMSINERDRYWCVALKDGTEVFAHAEDALIEDGHLNLRRADSHDPSVIMLSFAPGEWRFFYAASCIDGAAVCVEHWPGQIAR